MVIMHSKCVKFIESEGLHCIYVHIVIENL